MIQYETAFRPVCSSLWWQLSVALMQCKNESKIKLRCKLHSLPCKDSCMLLMKSNKSLCRSFCFPSLLWLLFYGFNGITQWNGMECIKRWILFISKKKKKKRQKVLIALTTYIRLIGSWDLATSALKVHEPWTSSLRKHTVCHNQDMKYNLYKFTGSQLVMFTLRITWLLGFQSNANAFLAIVYLFFIFLFKVWPISNHPQYTVWISVAIYHKHFTLQ